MNLIKENAEVIVLLIWFISMISLILINSSDTHLEQKLTTYDYTIPSDEIGYVVGSGSMLPSMYPDTDIWMVDFNPSVDRVLCGQIYVYKKNNTNIIHRFVYEDNKGNLYFKGDNNLLLDKPIKKSKISKKVKGIIYD